MTDYNVTDLMKETKAELLEMARVDRVAEVTAKMTKLEIAEALVANADRPFCEITGCVNTATITDSVGRQLCDECYEVINSIERQIEESHSLDRDKVEGAGFPIEPELDEEARLEQEERDELAQWIHDDQSIDAGEFSGDFDYSIPADEEHDEAEDPDFDQPQPAEAKIPGEPQLMATKPRRVRIYDDCLANEDLTEACRTLRIRQLHELKIRTTADKNLQKRIRTNLRKLGNYQYLGAIYRHMPTTVEPRGRLTLGRPA